MSKSFNVAISGCHNSYPRCSLILKTITIWVFVKDLSKLFFVILKNQQISKLLRIRENREHLEKILKWE